MSNPFTLPVALSQNDSNRSPPEATDPKFDLKAIPSFYFFNDDGEYLGIIVENPEYSSTLEEDILKILKRSI